MEEPLVTFGLVSDIQYADIEDRPAFHGQIRYFKIKVKINKKIIYK